MNLIKTTYSCCSSVFYRTMLKRNFLQAHTKKTTTTTQKCNKIVLKRTLMICDSVISIKQRGSDDKYFFFLKVKQFYCQYQQIFSQLDVLCGWEDFLYIKRNSNLRFFSVVYVLMLHYKLKIKSLILWENSKNYNLIFRDH